ncbi:hypothetical protein KAT95_02680 [Candidatus Parcubacteria bacterium]|nr:hypothetical protein [Candidatus Parcubacteria bacterium]
MATIKKKNLIIWISFSLTILLLIVFYFIGQQVPGPVEKPIPFENCQLLTDSCLDKNCSYYFLCEGVEFFSCSVYDCGDKYGILIKDRENETIVKEQAKPDKEKIKEARERCKGWTEVLEKKYENGKLEIKTSVVTKGDCEILSFIVKTDKGYQTPLFEKKDDYYNLVFSASLKDVFEIIAVGEGGVSIREK